MNFEVVEKKENSLLERTEISAVVSFDGATPAIAQMRDMVVQKLGCNPDLMVVREVLPGFGEQKVSIKVNIYKTPDRMKKVEEEYVLKRNNLVSEAPKEEKPKEEAPAEAPKAEEKKEEAPKEEKKEAPKEEKPPEEKKEEPKAEEKPPEEKKEEKKEE